MAKLASKKPVTPAANLADFIKYLRCPISSQPLRALTAGEMDALNLKIAATQLQHLSGETVKTPIKDGLTTGDQKYCYRIDNRIFILLADLAIPTGQPDFARRRRFHPNKQIVRQFYEQYGWKKSGDDYHDADEFEDLRLVVKDYIHRCHQRLGRYFQPMGRYFLDVASGPKKVTKTSARAF
jgi:uncharacterized protein YbaR (Trm112 family)